MSKFALWVPPLILLLASLACRPVVTIGWSEILVLAVIILVLLGPFLWRLYRFWLAYQERQRGPKE